MSSNTLNYFNQQFNQTLDWTNIDKDIYNNNICMIWYYILKYDNSNEFKYNIYCPLNIYLLDCHTCAR